MTKPNNPGEWITLQGLLSTALSIVLGATAPAVPSVNQAQQPLLSALLEVTAPLEISQKRWKPRVGDRIVFDTKNNVGFLIHPDETFLRFPIVTGQERHVCYIGLCYFAATPEDEWTIKSRHIKGDRVTYGPSGRFLRLYRDGHEYSHYGIHEHRDEEDMFSGEMRYRSMGCIIVKTDIMDILDETYQLNAVAGVDVKTVRGVLQ